MDLGCIDMDCLEKPTTDNKTTREAGVVALSKLTSQIKKPPHRKGSPINWFPRKKVDSYLKRKIKLLQEVGGMNSTLDETLGDSNPHYSKVLKEKMAVREAAHKAMETRKAAMVEASWCRILQAARINSKEAEAILLEAEKTALEAFEAAKAIGVIMYDMPECPQKKNELETSLVNGGRLSTHTVTAAFETAFEVDKQVGAAVKTAFVKLSSCPSISKEEFKELLRRISENPSTGGEGSQDVTEISSECDSDTGSELESEPNCENVASELKSRKNQRIQVSEKFNMTYLVDLMLERLRHLQEDELASLATIVATCGLSAALPEAAIDKPPDSSSLTDHHPRRVSSFGVVRSKNAEPELPSLDKFLVKHMTRLEREILEARDARMKGSKDGINKTVENTDGTKGNSLSSVGPDSDLRSVFVKHSLMLEKEIEEAKRTGINPYEMSGKKLDRMQNIQDLVVVPLDKILVRHMSRLEREVQEAKNRRYLGQNDHIAASATQIVVQEKTSLCSDGEPWGKENINSNKKGAQEVEKGDDPVQQQILDLKNGGNESKGTGTCSLDEILVKPVHRLERDKMQASSLGNEYVSIPHQNRRKNTRVEEWESLDKVMVKHVSRLEKEKAEIMSKEPRVKVKRNVSSSKAGGEGRLDQILVKPMSRLEKDKTAFAEKSNDQSNHVMSRREVRERELQEAWGGLSLGNSMRPHLSRLQRDKAAWVKAEEEERRKNIEVEKVV